MRFNQWHRVLFVLILGLVLTVYHVYRLRKNPNFFWAPAIDQKIFGSVARNFLEGKGFRLDSLEAYQFSENTTHLDCYTFSFLHPLLIANLMKFLNDFSHFPVLYSSVIYYLLSIPLFFLILSKHFRPPFALLGTFLFAISSEMINLGPSGQSESLMFIELFLALLIYLYLKNPSLSALLMGVTIGLMNITRPSGMILFPGFLFLSYKKGRSISALLFIAGFLSISFYGNQMTEKASLPYSRLTYPLVGSQEFGGSHEHFLNLNPNKLEIVITEYKAVIHKTFVQSLRMIRDLPHFFTDYWVFIPIALTLVIRGSGSSVWIGFGSLALLLSVFSVVGYWYVYRVTLHLFPMIFIASLFVIEFLCGNLKKKQWGTIFLLAPFIFFVITDRLTGHFKLIFELLIAGFFVWAILNTRQRFVAMSLPVLLVAMFLAIQVRQLNSNIQSYRRFLEPSELFPYQKDMALLPSLRLKEDSISICEQMRNLAWFGKMRGLYYPSNLEDAIKYLERYSKPIYLVLLNSPHPNFSAHLHSLGLNPLDLGLKNLWVFEKKVTPLSTSNL